VLLVDDVLYTGRTVRAAMNELFDYGRPASIDLGRADRPRGGANFPIAPSVVGRTIRSARRGQRGADPRVPPDVCI